ncbi:MAG: sulfite exporter TauE/SafE family protein, partial [Hyphomicrobiales bacterium]|nr:sulfite exporter TauE/SafE family protein [Hyphomicrobiales bacterium]
VAVPVMATVIEPATAVALTFVPVALANIWQALQGGHFRAAFAAYWPFTLAFGLGIAAGTNILVALDPKTMALAIGVFVIVSALLQWWLKDFAISQRTARWSDPVCGLGLGIMSGATAMFTPLIVYFSARRPEKDVFIAQIALCMISGSVPLYAILAMKNVLSGDEALVSTLAFLPALFGLMAGKWVRDRMSQHSFRRMLLAALVLLGLALIAKGVS